MTAIRCVCIALVLSIGTMAPDARAGGAVDDIRLLIGQLQEDWNAGDMQGYMAAYANSDDLRLLSSAGIYKGWQTVDSTFRAQFPDEAAMGDFFVDGLDIRVLTNDVALASGSFRHVFDSLTIEGSFSHVLRRHDDGRWLIELEHVSRTGVVNHDDQPSR